METIINNFAALPPSDKTWFLFWWALWLVWLIATGLMTYRLVRAAIRLMRQKKSPDIAYEEGQEPRRATANRRRSF